MIALIDEWLLMLLCVAVVDFVAIGFSGIAILPIDSIVVVELVVVVVCARAVVASTPAAIPIKILMSLSCFGRQGIDERVVPIWKTVAPGSSDSRPASATVSRTLA